MNFETISAKDVDNYIGKDNVQIIDLREPEEYKEGHIPTSINIPFREFENKMNQLSISGEFILYCDRGNLSLLLARDLSKEGYQMKTIYGGMRAYRGKIVRGSH